MRSLQGTAQWAVSTLVSLIVLGGINVLRAQQVWPGDINNNGIVNGVDLLYHGVAEGGSGPERINTGTSWEAYNPALAWDGQFIDGLNYSQADVNGKGSVEQSDRKALWRKNYGQVHGAVIPDLFMSGNPAIDPVLNIVPVHSEVDAGDLIELSLNLGDVSNPITNFFGLTFTLSFDPDHIADETTSPLWNPDVLNIELSSGNWLNPNGDDVETFVQIDNAAGKLEVVIMRKNPGTVEGHGQIASIMGTNIEDIVMLEGATTTFTIDDIKLVDDNLVEYPVAGSTTSVVINAEGAALVAANENESEVSDASNSVGIQTLQVDSPTAIGTDNWREEAEVLSVDCRVYPNPVVDRLQVSLNTPAEDIEGLRLFSANGQLMRQVSQVEAPRAEIEVSDLPSGNYFLQVQTSAGPFTKIISK